MFGNFTYFIIVLLIYNTYQPSTEKNFPLIESLPLFFAITIGFFYYTRLRFEKLEKRLTYVNPVIIDRRFTSLQTHHCIFSIGLFAVHIYVLNLPSFLINVQFFKIIPTLLAIIFISIFVIYLSIIWGVSHRLYQKLYHSTISRRSYIFSNISFSIPVLLPWMLLSGVADLLNALPFNWPKTFLATTFGQIVYFVFFLFVVAIIGPLIIQTFWRCRPLESGYYREKIESLCRKAGLKYSDILYWPIFGGRMITAGVMGLVGRFRYILVTNALLRMLTSEEIEAVIAHEIGHIKRYHLLFYLLFFIGYPLLYYAFTQPIDLLISFAGAPHGVLDKLGLNSTITAATLFNLIMIAAFLIYFRYLFGYFMRNFERQADTYVYSLLSSARPLISTFQKIASTSTQPPDKPNWHHFSIKERIDFLADCEVNRTRVEYHNHKIRKSIIVYLVFLITMGITGYYLNFSQKGIKFREYLLERSILNEIYRNPDNVDLYNAIAMFYYNRKNYAEAINAYESSLKLDPDQDQTLNNLSWLYATCEKTKYRNPQRAVILAQNAVRLNSSPEILDTLAESYFVNGQIKEAIEIELEALAKAKDRTHYEKQLNKFMQTFK
ncbi:MAG: M48 family metalloprotease [Desulfobacteraceae bacterium]|jgi:Zn-dependent protease with chaperone function